MKKIVNLIVLLSISLVMLSGCGQQEPVQSTPVSKPKTTTSAKATTKKKQTTVKTTKAPKATTTEDSEIPTTEFVIPTTAAKTTRKATDDEIINFRKEARAEVMAQYGSSLSSMERSISQKQEQVSTLAGRRDLDIMILERQMAEAGQYNESVIAAKKQAVYNRYTSQIASLNREIEQLQDDYNALKSNLNILIETSAQKKIREFEESTLQ